MSNWALIIYCGLITYLTRFSMIALIKKEMFNDRIREILSYVPSAIFPAIIFPAIFLDNSGSILFEDNPKIIAALIATLIGIFFKKYNCDNIFRISFLLVFNFCSIKNHEKNFYIYLFFVLSFSFQMVHLQKKQLSKKNYLIKRKQKAKL